MHHEKQLKHFHMRNYSDGRHQTGAASLTSALLGAQVAPEKDMSAAAEYRQAQAVFDRSIVSQNVRDLTLESHRLLLEKVKQQNNSSVERRSESVMPVRPRPSSTLDSREG